MKIRTSLNKRDTEASGILSIEGNHWLIHTIFEWEQLWGKWNWVDFHPILVHVMRDVAIPGYEFEMAVLGVGFRLRINGDWNRTKTGRNLLEFDEAMKAGNLEHSKGECPFCKGTGECLSCKGTGEVGIASVKGHCDKCGYSLNDCECRDSDGGHDDGENCGNPNCYEC